MRELLRCACLVIALGACAIEPTEPVDIWWGQLQGLCGQAFEGQLASSDEADAELAGETMVMHVRECSAEIIRVPFHIGENRSRTWVLRRDAAGLSLHHDHRHEDGESDAITMYGGHSALPGGGEMDGTVVYFPADEGSKALFEREGIPQSKPNVWSMELLPGERFSYILRRPGRYFQADFDLTRSVEAPPPPWGFD